MKLKTILFAVSALLLGGAVACTNAQTDAPKKDKGIQLYSVRHLLDEGQKYHDNLPGLLKSVSDNGYTHVEAANYDNGKGLFYGLTPEEFAKACEEAGLKATSSHTGRSLSADEMKSGDYSEFYKWWDKTIADHKAAGMEYIVMPWMNVPDSLADLKKQCEALSEVTRRCEAQGLKFGYHNHSHEFKEVEGVKMLDYMIENTNPEMLYEMDVYWTMYGHAAPVDYFKKYPGRFKLLHIKDLREIGQSGMVGFDAIFNNADTAGVENFYVEIEEFTGDPEEGIRQSAEYLDNAPFVRESYKK